LKSELNFQKVWFYSNRQMWFKKKA
jgi:hypothetical protein